MPRNNDVRVVVVHHLILGYQHFAQSPVDKILHQVTADQALVQAFDGLFAILDIEDLQAVCWAAILFPDDDILGNVYQTTGQVTESAVRRAVSAKPFGRRGKK